MKTFDEYVNESERVDESLMMALSFPILMIILGGIGLAFDAGDDVRTNSSRKESGFKMFFAKLFSKLMTPEKKIELARKIANTRSTNDAKAFISTIKSEMPDELVKKLNRIESSFKPSREDRNFSNDDLSKKIKELKESSIKYIESVKKAKNSKFDTDIELNKPLNDLKIGDVVFVGRTNKIYWAILQITSMTFNKDFVTLRGVHYNTNKYYEAVIDLSKISNTDHIEYYDGEYDRNVCFSTNKEKFLEYCKKNLPTENLRENAKRQVESLVFDYEYKERINALSEEMGDGKLFKDVEESDWVFCVIENGEYELFKPRLKKKYGERLLALRDSKGNQVAGLVKDDLEKRTVRNEIYYSYNPYIISTDVKEFLNKAKNFVKKEEMDILVDCLDKIAKGTDKDIFSTISSYKDIDAWRKFFDDFDREIRNNRRRHEYVPDGISPEEWKDLNYDDREHFLMYGYY